MAKYAVLRLQKIKDKGSLVRAFQHDTRDRTPPHAVQERSHLNTADCSTDEATARYQALLPSWYRKNAVHAVEFVVSASKETELSVLEPYFKDSQEWLLQRLGGPENHLQSAIHYDEDFPHLHLILMPLRDGELNYNSYLGGNKFQLRALQTDFAKEVANHYGLERGIQRSGIEHRNYKAYHAQLASPPPSLPPLKPEILQDPKLKALPPAAYCQELARLHQQAYEPIIAGLVIQANRVPILEQDKQTVMKVSSARAEEIDGLRKMLSAIQECIIENGPRLEAYRKKLLEAKAEREKQTAREKRNRDRDNGLGR
jgi:hypothetical protein